MVEVYGRKVTLRGTFPDGVVIEWDKRDPDDKDMLAGVRAIPGRELIGGTTWRTPINIEAAEFLDFWEFPVKGKLRTLLSATKKAPASERYDVRPGPGGFAEITRSEKLIYIYVDELKKIGSKIEDGRFYYPLSPALLDYARQHALSVDPEVEEAVARLSAEAQAAEVWAKSLNQASRASDPSDLPSTVLDKLKEMYP